MHERDLYRTVGSVSIDLDWKRLTSTSAIIVVDHVSVVAGIRETFEVWSRAQTLSFFSRIFDSDDSFSRFLIKLMRLVT